jgi:hypothetical protein
LSGHGLKDAAIDAPVDDWECHTFGVVRVVDWRSRISAKVLDFVTIGQERSRDFPFPVDTGVIGGYGNAHDSNVLSGVSLRSGPPRGVNEHAGADRMG